MSSAGTDRPSEPDPAVDRESARAIDWPSYLRRFHDDRPGSAESVLGRALAGDHTPYRWLARAVANDARTVLDVACGSGPVTRELDRPGRRVIGLDLSAGELRVAATQHGGPWLRGDALRLPFADGSVDAVTSSMGLVVITPLDRLVAEIARVLKPGGVLAAIAPALRPMGARDLRTLGPLTTRLRARPRFPGPVERTGFTAVLGVHGLRKVEDARERYQFTISSRADAEVLLSGLYLPYTGPARVARAAAYLARRVARTGPVHIAVPMRRLVALK